MSSLNPPCAACKILRRKCTQECVFGPYFPPDQPQKFASVHKVFGASNVAKILNELNPGQREDAVNSLAYEADARLQNPVYGCVGLISVLQHKLKQLQSDLYDAKKDLAEYIGSAAMPPILQHPSNNPSSTSVIPYGMSPMTGIPIGSHQQQVLDAQQLGAAVVAREHQDMLRSYGDQQQQGLVRFDGDGMVANGFNQMGLGVFDGSDPIQAQQDHNQMGLGVFDGSDPIQAQQDHAYQLQAQLLLQHPQQTQQQQERSGSEEGRSVGPSC